jgi:hypothetical protein
MHATLVIQRAILFKFVTGILGMKIVLASESPCRRAGWPSFFGSRAAMCDAI